MSVRPVAASASVGRRVSEALTGEGLPAWAAIPVNLGGAGLLVALFGLVWDVAYHVDHGRDQNLFTGPHVVILVGLAAIGAAAAASVLWATLDETHTGWRIGPLRVPHAALPMGVMSASALAGFPLDELWHRTYGIDVTLWSPTHLIMIAGAALTTFAVPLFPVEAGRPLGRLAAPSWRVVLMLGGLLLALSVFQLEFDFGVPQFQAVYQPLLIAISAGIALPAARVVLGAGGAVRATILFLLVRGLLALVIGPGLGHTLPRFPVYLGCALAVEAAFWLARGRRPLIVAAASGLLAGTLGMAVEWGWSHLWGRLPWSGAMLPRMWLPLCAAVLAAVVGVALGRVLAGQRAGIPAPILVLAVLGLAAALAAPLPRNGAPVRGHLVTATTGAPRPVVDRFGLQAQEQDVTIEITLTPTGAAQGADWFEVLAWQGGGQRGVPLVEVAPGRYRSAEPVPTGGGWKAQAYLARGDVMVAMPIVMPVDPQYQSPAVALMPVRDGEFVPAPRLLTSETHGGPPWVAAIAYAALLGMAAIWAGLLMLGYRAVAAAHRRR